MLENNLFAYCLNNPVNYADNDGHIAKKMISLLSVAAIAAALLVGIKVAIVITAVLVVVAAGAIVSYSHRTLKNGSKKKSNDKHTKPKPGRESEKKKQKSNWRRRK